MGLKRTDKLGAVWIWLFALPFAGVGVAAFCYLGFTLWSWQQMTSWVPVPAEIVSLQLERHQGDDAVTHKVVAHYRYRFAGREYDADRAAIASMSDNLGSFQQQLYRELESARARHTAVAFVDPANPANATLNRDLRWTVVGFSAMFGLIFGGIGFGLLFWAHFGARNLASQRELEQRFPKEPWRWRKEWQDGRITSSNRASAYMATIFAALWNLIAFPVALFVPGAIAKGNWLALIALLFPAVGIGLAALAIRSWLRLKRFKTPTLLLNRVPIALGARLHGTVKVDALIPVTDEFELRLNCVERRRSSNNKESNERLLWQNEWTIPRHACQLTSTYSTIPVDVAVPEHAPASSTGDDDDRIVWRLEITGQCTGPDFAATFDVPVFAVADERDAPGVTTSRRAGPVPAKPRDWLASLEADEAARAAAHDAEGQTATPAPDPHRLATLGIVYERLPAGREAWTFRRAQHKGVALGLTGFTLVWTAITVGIGYAGAPFIFPIVFGLFDVLFVWWLLQLWFTEYRVTLDEETLTILASGLGGAKTYRIPRRQITSVRARRGMQAGNKLYYDLKVETGDRKTRTAATSLGDYSVAEWLAEHWMSAPGQTA